MSADTIPPGTGVPLDHPWCPPERPYPESYAAALAEDPARCVAEDPCSGDGETTLWRILPCTTPTTTTITVEVGMPPVPPTLPATGASSEAIGNVAAVALLAGLALHFLRRMGAR